MSFRLPSLPYQYQDLEPHIDAKTMKIHHTKHHQGYIDKLNAALENYDDLKELPLETLLADIDNIPAKIYQSVRNNGGGHANHSLFWNVMSPQGGGQPQGDLADAITASFGSFDSFKQEFTATANTHFGSGWTWLTYEPDGKLHVCDSDNQDSPLMHGNTPILGLDIWEHAYYLHYQNRRADYIDAWWNVVNWDQVSANLKTAQSS